MIDREGNSFERAAIMNWLRRKGESPITRSRIAAKDLCPNRALREAIEVWRGEAPGGHAGERVAVDSHRGCADDPIVLDETQGPIVLDESQGPLVNDEVAPEAASSQQLPNGSIDPAIEVTASSSWFAHMENAFAPSSQDGRERPSKRQREQDWAARSEAARRSSGLPY